MNEVASFHAKENKIFEFICEAKKWKEHEKFVSNGI